MKLTSGLVGAEANGPIGWLIWDNPSKLNALSPDMYEDALSVVEDYVADPAIKVVVMRGTGRKAFVSGADIKSFEKTRANAETARLATDECRIAAETARSGKAADRDDLRLLPRRRARRGAKRRFALRVVGRAVWHPRGGARRRVRAGRAKAAG